MLEALYCLATNNWIALPLGVAGPVAGLTILYGADCCRPQKRAATAFLIAIAGFIVFRAFSNFILTEFGTGVTYWSAEAYASEKLAHSGPAQQARMIFVQDAMFFLTYRFFPGALFAAGLLVAALTGFLKSKQTPIAKFILLFLLLGFSAEMGLMILSDVTGTEGIIK